jgi:uncharacterized protein YidB (DUF937 family)
LSDDLTAGGNGMGLLDQFLGSIFGGNQAQNTPTASPGAPGGSALLSALIALLASRALGNQQGGLGGGGLGQGGLGDVLGNILGGQATNAPGQPANAPVSAGLDELLERFQQNGYGDIIQSWIGSGENSPISPNQLREVLGSDAVSQLSERTGMPQDDLVAEISKILPGAVDQFTPQGHLPTPEEQRDWI